MGVDLAAEETKDKTVFNFVCQCGHGIVAPVPPEGNALSVECECGVIWKLTWKGDHFETRMSR